MYETIEFVDACLSSQAITALHPTAPTIAKADGSLIIVHEISTESKFKLQRH